MVYSYVGNAFNPKIFQGLDGRELTGSELKKRAQWFSKLESNLNAIIIEKADKYPDEKQIAVANHNAIEALKVFGEKKYPNLFSSAKKLRKKGKSINIGDNFMVIHIDINRPRKVNPLKA